SACNRKRKSPVRKTSVKQDCCRWSGATIPHPSKSEWASQNGHRLLHRYSTQSGNRVQRSRIHTVAPAHGCEEARVHTVANTTSLLKQKADGRNDCSPGCVRARELKA